MTETTDSAPQPSTMAKALAVAKKLLRPSRTVVLFGVLVAYAKIVAAWQTAPSFLVLPGASKTSHRIGATPLKGLRPVQLQLNYKSKNDQSLIHTLSSLASGILVFSSYLSWTSGRRRGRHQHAAQLVVMSAAEVADPSSSQITASPNSSSSCSKWKCISGCGACCYLSEQDRPYLQDLLSPDEYTTFKGLVASDGWCRHFDKENRGCQIYDDRPVFCRVKTWLNMKADGFGVDTSDEEEVEAFPAYCCREHIGAVYGDSSEEMQRFNEEVSIGLEDLEEVPEGVSATGELDDEGFPALPEGWQVADEDPFLEVEYENADVNDGDFSYSGDDDGDDGVIYSGDGGDDDEEEDLARSHMGSWDDEDDDESEDDLEDDDEDWAAQEVGTIKTFQKSDDADRSSASAGGGGKKTGIKK
eukprot:TRINITY_DN16870_c0_g1_i2.p1 TRINITY_DN16870_c0_g1~~TRINITY_DN16870_c0_g1_i2.p1  ORF type:complete len:415 (-),score=111.05 TRINITY_DN16870_c0_g1_i2:24-1268(-)